MADQPSDDGTAEQPRDSGGRSSSLTRLSPRDSDVPLSDTRVFYEISDDESEDEVDAIYDVASDRHFDAGPLRRESIAYRPHSRSLRRDSSRGRGTERDGRAAFKARERSPRRYYQTHKRRRTGSGSEHSSGQQLPPLHDKNRQVTPELPVLEHTGASLHHKHRESKSKSCLERGQPAVRGQYGGQVALNPYTLPSMKSREEKSAHGPPYYVDGLFEVRMYNGPGYERFPVVLGTVQGHQEACDKWDAEQSKRLERESVQLRRQFRQQLRNPYVIHGTDSESSDTADSEGEEVEDHEQQCLTNVLEVFPDIEVAFVKQEISTYSQQSAPSIDAVALEATPLAEKIIAEILEMESYPKECSSSLLAKGSSSADDGTGITVMWYRDLPKDAMYFKDAVILLAKSFDHVPTDYIAAIVGQKKSLFNAYVHIQEQEDQYYLRPTRPYDRLRQPRQAIEEKYLLARNDYRIPGEYVHRVNELQAAKQHVAREAIQEAAKRAKEGAEAENLAKYKEMGALMECGCCFDEETPLNRMVSCLAEEPHFFCFTCVESMAETQVGLLRYEMRCMDASGCAAELSNDGVGKAVPIQIFDCLAMSKQQAEIQAAGIEGLEQCRWCEYQAVCDEVEKDPVFYCLNPECKRATCRKCREDNHLPSSCEEHRQYNALAGRHRVEEARTDAVIRQCSNPKCGVSIIKESGCNKMICTKCNTLMCYACKANLTALGENPYDHFRTKGSKCPLYDADEVEVRHKIEANRAEKEAIKKAKDSDASIDESQLRIESDKETDKPKKSKLDDHPAANVFYRGMNHRAGRLDWRQRHLQEMAARVEVMRDLIPDPVLAATLANLPPRPALAGTRRGVYEWPAPREGYYPRNV